MKHVVLDNIESSMDTPFPIKRKYDYPTLTRTTFESGYRVYNTPEGHAVPSVTTILSTLPKDALVAWRERVGVVEAKRITDEACDIGTNMHDMLEGYVSNYLQGKGDVLPVTENEKVAHRLANNLIKYGLADLDEVWGIEENLYCEDIYAGCTDLIGVYKGKSAVCDYKNSRRWKQPEWVEAYKMQLAAYNFAHKSMFGEGMETGVILIAIRPEAKCVQTVQRFILNKKDMDYYEDKWIQLVNEYYNKKV